MPKCGIVHGTKSVAMDSSVSFDGTYTYKMYIVQQHTRRRYRTHMHKCPGIVHTYIHSVYVHGDSHLQQQEQHLSPIYIYTEIELKCAMESGAHVPFAQSASKCIRNFIQSAGMTSPSWFLRSYTGWMADSLAAIGNMGDSSYTKGFLSLLGGNWTHRRKKKCSTLRKAYILRAWYKQHRTECEYNLYMCPLSRLLACSLVRSLYTSVKWFVYHGECAWISCVVV